MVHTNVVFSLCSSLLEYEISRVQKEMAMKHIELLVKSSKSWGFVLSSALVLLLASCGNQTPEAVPEEPPKVDETLDPAQGGLQELLSEPEEKLTTQASYHCPYVFTRDGRAYAKCHVHSGQVRVRADCKYFPDLYSPWVGRGWWWVWTGKCPFGIRSAIIESRY
jgi:hypothetical protein